MSEADRAVGVYRYEDDEGQLYFVDSWDAIPETYRDGAVRVESSPKGFFKYQDSGGRTVVVDDWALVPEAYRPQVERLLGEVPRRGEDQPVAASRSTVTKSKRTAKKSSKTAKSSSGPMAFVRGLDLPSVAVGVALALGLYVGLQVFRRSGRLLLKVILTAGVCALVASAYFGWARRSAGLSDDSLAAPTEILDDARRAASELKRSIRRQERTLHKIEEQSR